MRDNVYQEYKQTIHYSNRTGVRAVCSDCQMGNNRRNWHRRWSIDLQRQTATHASGLVVQFIDRLIFPKPAIGTHCSAEGIGEWTGFLLLSLLAATAVAALQTVGACLVVAMLVTPGATAYLLTDRFGKMLIIATITGLLCGVLGAYGSYFLNGSTGGCIVVLQTLVFLVALFLAPKHGLLASRRQRRIASLS